MLHVGQGIVETVPPLGIEMAGFHRQPGNERRITGIRQPTACRALVLEKDGQRFILLSCDVCAVSRSFAERIQQAVARMTSIPAGHVRVHATHTHSMPTGRFFRQWGAISSKYMSQLTSAMVRAARLSIEDLAPADLYLGKARTVDANFNRTTKTWKTDKDFGPDAADDQRWLDTELHVLHFLREKPKGDILWYHFSAHPVCYTDGNAGPDWPGLVDERVRAYEGLSPGFLQGHCGDVNPGPGKPWLGEPEKVADAVYEALHHAFGHARLVHVDRIGFVRKDLHVPLDIDRFGELLEQYRKAPAECASGQWVDARFAEDWAKSAARWDMTRSTLDVPVSALRLGEIALLFHPAELFSFYGLDIRRDSPFSDTLVIGYTDGFIGYLPDPQAYRDKEYAAVVVPKILDLPPFTPTAAREFTKAVKATLTDIA